VTLKEQEYADSSIHATGQFQWDGENFSHSAQNVSFSIEGGGEVPVLRAELQNMDGEWVAHDVNLAERIENQNGEFVFGKSHLVGGPSRTTTKY